MLNKYQARKPRKILRIKPTKYEGSEIIHSNKRYWNNVFDELTTDNKPVEEKEMKVLAEVLPSDLCKKVCSILNIEAPPEASAPEEKPEDNGIRRTVKYPQLSKRKTINITRELESDTDVEINSSDGQSRTNIHHEFLKKPEREQITWPTRYLEPEREDEKTLIKKADDLTDRIVHDFCDYMKQLGGSCQQSQLFTPKAIKELFQIEFDTHVARSLKVDPKEMPTVEERIAAVTDNPQKSRFSALGREISKDIKAEQRPDHLLAFSRSITHREQWRAPRNDTKNLWRSARHVPRDLVTLKAVWEGITNLRSVKDYCRWMIEHPEYRRAPYLQSIGMFDAGVLDARLTFELQQMSPALLSPVEVPAPIEQIRKRLSLLAETPLLNS